MRLWDGLTDKQPGIGIFALDQEIVFTGKIRAPGGARRSRADSSVRPGHRDPDRLPGKLRCQPGPLREVEAIAFGLDVLLGTLHRAGDAVQHAPDLLLKGCRKVRRVGAAGVQCRLAQLERNQSDDGRNRDDYEPGVGHDAAA